MISNKTHPVLLSFLLASCGASPLLNHKNADELKVQAPQEPTNLCALRLAKSGRCLKISWLRGPFNDRESIVIVNQHTLNQADGTVGAYVNFDATETLELDPQMPSMGHGSYENPVVQLLGDGLVLAKNVVFTMEGDWELNFILKRNGVEVDRAVLPVKIL